MKVDKTLNQIITELRTSGSVSGVSRAHMEEIDELVPVVETLLSVPKAIVPTAYREHRYAQALKPKAFTNRLYILMRASLVPVSVLAGLTLFVGTGYAAQNSKPGENLFFVKKSFEQTTLIFTPEDQKPQARLALVEKRLADAQQVLTDPSHDPATAKAALDELNQQAQNTFSDVRKVADTQELSAAQVNILSTLAEINKKQEALANTIEPTDEQTTELKETATKEAQASGENIQKLIATVTEKTGATEDDPNEITISGGIISSVNRQWVVVEKNLFTIDRDEVIITKDGQPFEQSKLTTKMKVTIIGTKDNNSFKTKSIEVIEVPVTASAAVKGVATEQTDSTKVSTEPTPDADDPDTASEENVRGGFISEQP